jgi:NADPH:quinone reductase-like Zn-dependent oxidoreductase
VFGETVRGHPWNNGGAYAEYAAAPESALALKPANVTFEQAAAVPTSGLIALPALRGGGKIQAGQKVLVNGAGGGVGTVAVQLAKAFGADVTGVDTADKLDRVRSLGADQVIDCTQQDFTRNGERYDLILDIPGNHSLTDCRRALTPGGSYVLVGHDNYGDGMHRWAGLLPRMFKLMALSPFVTQLRGMGVTMPDKEEAMALFREFLETGKLTPHIDKTYPLRAVPEAMRYLQEGRARGKIIVTP